MIFSVFGFVADYAFSPGSGPTSVEYGDFTFKVRDGQYFTVVEGYDHGFIFFPGDLQHIQVPDDVNSLIASDSLTITYDPSTNFSRALGEAQYYFEAQLQNTREVERSLTDNEGTTLTQKTCEDATGEQPVIFLEEGDSSISADGNCVKVSARDAFDLIQQSERLIYSALGVMS
jgi:hypothetical protein